jgi:hypothetical protein
MWRRRVADRAMGGGDVGLQVAEDDVDPAEADGNHAMSNRPTTVSILATSDTSASTLYGLFDVLNSVGVGWQTFVTGKPVEPQFDVRIVAASSTRCSTRRPGTLTTAQAVTDRRSLTPT